MPENQHTEYKQKLTSNIEKGVVAFLNTNEGGVIYIGIDDQGNIIGIPDADQAQLILKDRLKNNILPSCLGLFDLVVEEREGKEIIKLIVAGGSEKPYYIKKYGLSEKGAFIRVGSASEPMPTRQIEKLFSRRTHHSISRIKSPKRELRFQQLHIYYQSLGKNLNAQFAQNLELLNEEGLYNYVAYLMSDNNNISVKFARYKGLTRVDLVESNEYGYESLIKATHQILDKLNVENRTQTQITGKERLEKRLWHHVAVREAVINAFVHNDYSREIAPTFEIFDDRMEITSYGGLPEGLKKEEFFDGYSVPRNKELMRIYKDLDFVEQLGSGIPRILEFYDEKDFKFSENFLRIILPASDPTNRQIEQVPDKHPTSTPQVPHKYPTSTPQVIKLLKIFTEQHSRQELQDNLGLADRKNFLIHYLQPAIEQELVALTIPDKPRSSKQKYYLTEKGKKFIEDK